MFFFFCYQGCHFFFLTNLQFVVVVYFLYLKFYTKFFIIIKSLLGVLKKKKRIMSETLLGIRR